MRDPMESLEEIDIDTIIDHVEACGFLVLNQNEPVAEENTPDARFVRFHRQTRSWGKNSWQYCTGLHLYHASRSINEDLVILKPINTKGVSTSVEVEIPREEVANLISHLSVLMNLTE